MAYKKKRGILSCVIVGYTPLWLDVVNSKSGIEACVFLKFKMSDKMKDSMNRSIENAERKHILVEKMPEDQHYRFLGFSGGSHLGQQKKMERRIAYEALEREIGVDYNPAKGKSGQSLLIGRDGLRNFDRTGDKISRALSNRIDNSKEYEEKKRKLEGAKIVKEKKKFLAKLRKKYFYDRELQPTLSDAKWDAYLLETYSGDCPVPPKTDSQFEAELDEIGLL